MTNKNKKSMSLAISVDLQQELKDYAKKRGQTTSAYVQDLIEKGIQLSVEEEPLVIGNVTGEEVIPLTLQIPKKLTSSSEHLRLWLNNQTVAIVCKLCNI